MTKKRGRGRPKKIKNENKKTKKIFNINNFLNKKKEDFNNLLVHLPIDINLIKINDNLSYENQYLDYNNILNTIENVPEPFQDETHEENVNFNKKIQEYKEDVILKNQVLNKTIYKLDEKVSNVLCWWCCHSFDGQKYGIPIRKEKDIYITKGNFCSLNCCKSYNQTENLKLFEIQKRNTLINMLNKELNKDDKFIDVIEAPARETLEIFGGKLSIEEFRNKKTILKLIYPPIITIIPDLEEIKIVNGDNKLKINKKIKNNLLKLFN